MNSKAPPAKPVTAQLPPGCHTFVADVPDPRTKNAPSDEVGTHMETLPGCYRVPRYQGAE